MQHEDVPPFDSLPLTRDQIRDLRSDHAGETGAVAIYQGILATTRSPVVREFAREHLRTERRHLRFFDVWLPQRYHSRLLPLWRLAGWLLGAVPALVSEKRVFRTIGAVETFVERHYLDQIEAMEKNKALSSLAHLLQSFCDDEIEHRVDALERARAPSAGASGPWAAVVGVGSAIGVAVARRI